MTITKILFLRSLRAWLRCGLTLSMLALVSLIIPSSAAQSTSTGTVTGRVVNQATGEYLRNARITVVGTDVAATSGAGGVYILGNVPAGDTKLSVSYTGLDAVEESVSVPAGQTVQRDINLTSGLYAQDKVLLGEFRVASTREGNAKAIMQQRVAINPTKVVASDAMGNVSEGNVGEFLKLMPGVVMDYVEADTRALRVRGLAPKYSAVLFDGMPLANAASAAIGTGRAFEFEQLSISSVETVELTKVPAPEQPSNVAGTVNLRTKSAFDRAGRRITWSTALSANSYYLDTEQSQGWDDENHYKLLPNFSFEYSESLLGGKLGVALGVQRSYTLAAQKHIWFFYNNNDADFSNNGSEWPTINRIWYQDGPKPTQRDTSYLRFDFKLTSNLTTSVYAGYNDYDAKFYNRSLSFFPGTFSENTPTSQTIATGRASIHSNQYRNKKGNTAIFSSNTAYENGAFRMTLGLQYSRGRSNYESISTGHFSDYSTSLPNISWRVIRDDRDSQDLYFTQLTGADWRNPANYTFDANSIAYPERWAIDDVLTGRLDFRHGLNVGETPVTLKWGASTYRNTREVKNYNFQYSLTGQNPSAYAETSFTTDWGVGGNSNGWAQISPWLLAKQFAANPGLFTPNAAGNLQSRLQNNWDFEEDVHALYGQAIFKLGRLEIAPGMRFEATKSSGMGTRILNNAQLTALGFNPATDAANLAFVQAKFGGKLTDGNSYDAYLKYLNLNYKFTQNFILRASYHDALTRADLSNLVPGIGGINETDRIVTAANPDLKEERSENINVGIEYYFEPVGVISISGFHSTIKDRQAANISTLDATGFNGDTAYAGWRLNTTLNVGNALKVSGVEVDYSQQLSFLPGIWSGFGVFANNTLMHYDDRAFFLGSPTWAANAGVNYSRGKFSSRINANWVGKRLDNPGRSYNVVTNQWTPSGPFATEYTADRLQLDLNLEYRVTSSVTVFLDGRNFLNEPSTYSYRGTEDNFMRILRTGGIWMFGVKGRF